MATFGIARNGSPTTNPWLNSLITETQWQRGSSVTTITYSFNSGPNSAENLTGAAWKAFEQTAYKQALQSWSNVANLQFVEDTSGNGNFQEYLDGTMGSDGTLGWHYLPQAGSDVAVGAYDNSQWNSSSLAVGGYDFTTFVHELGHALGLNHPHDAASDTDKDLFPGVSDGQSGQLGTNNLNQSIFTVMSYNDGWKTQFPNHSDNTYGWVAGPMAFDIAAIQLLYGANTTYKTGNDSYALPTRNGAGTYWSCIWDAGGTDTISAATANASATIDLRAAPLTGTNAGGYVNWVRGIVGGFTIANGVTIENAIGGNANDTITGNDADNNIDGGKGADTMAGLGGNDTYRVDNSADNIIEAAGNGTDTVIASITYKLGSNVENLTLTGSANINGTGNDLANVIIGNDGINTLDGGAGADTLQGGKGGDIYIVNHAGDVIIEGSDGGIDRVQSSVSYTLAANVENLTLTGTAAINGTGNGLGNTITGNSAANVLKGFGGNDTLNGGDGADQLFGGGGADSLTGGTGADRFVFDTALRDGIDTIADFVSRSDKIVLAKEIFIELGSTFEASEFFSGASATNDLQHIIYNRGTGALFYDADGSGSGAAIQFALLANKAALAFTDFAII